MEIVKRAQSTLSYGFNRSLSLSGEEVLFMEYLFLDMPFQDVRYKLGVSIEEFEKLKRTIQRKFGDGNWFKIMNRFIQSPHYSMLSFAHSEIKQTAMTYAKEIKIILGKKTITLNGKQTIIQNFLVDYVTATKHALCCSFLEETGGIPFLTTKEKKMLVGIYEAKDMSHIENLGKTSDALKRNFRSHYLFFVLKKALYLNVLHIPFITNESYNENCHYTSKRILNLPMPRRKNSDWIYGYIYNVLLEMYMYIENKHVAQS